MLLLNQPGILLISRDPSLLAALESVLLPFGVRLNIVLSPQLALANLASADPPSLILFDIDATGGEGETSFSHWLAQARATSHGHSVPIVLMADSIREDWTASIADGTLDDLIPRGIDSPYWRLRLGLVLRTYHRMRELERLRESTAMDAQLDRLTGIFNRASLLSMLFRETDRVQRMKTSLSLILFDIDSFGDCNEHLGSSACDDLLCQVVSRTMRLLRSYDVFGRTGHDEFLLILPGCGTADAQMLCERLRVEVFGTPYQIAGQSVRLSACFGIAPSQGRSPIVVLRAAEEALTHAKRAGFETIHCAGSCAAEQSTADFLSASSGEELLAW